MSADVADTVTSVLRGVIQKGTGTQASIRRAAAGKTGTTGNNDDAWFVGYTCHLTTSVWIGYPTPTPMTNVHGITVNGGTFPAQIWRNYMAQATASQGPCTYRNIDAGTNTLTPLLVAGPPTTTTSTTVPPATTTTVPPAAPPATSPPAAPTTAPPPG
jgi:penicillin-binding protein 1A